MEIIKLNPKSKRQILINELKKSIALTIGNQDFCKNKTILSLMHHAEIFFSNQNKSGKLKKTLLGKLWVNCNLIILKLIIL